MNKDYTDKSSPGVVNKTKFLQAADVPSELLDFLPPDAKIIVDISCKENNTSYYYKRINPHGVYFKVLVDPELNQFKSESLEQVILTSKKQLETLSLDLHQSTVDCVMYDNILHQLSNPLKILKHQTSWLKPEGQVLALIPNSQYWKNIVSLLQGQKQQENNNYIGLSLETIQELFWKAGLLIYEIQTKGQKHDEFKKFIELIEPMRDALGLDKNRFATQTAAEYYLIRAIKSVQPPRRLVIQTAIMAPTGCDRIRVLEPDQLSSTIPGIRTISAIKSIPTGSILPGEEKVFIWQRTILSYQHHLEFLKQLLKQNYLIIAEIDDNPLRRREYAENRYLSYRGCHGVQTSTKPLAVFLQQFNPHVAVFPNQLANLPPLNINQNEIVTLFFGALNREKDWEPIIETLNRVLVPYSHRVRVKVIHDRRFFDSLDIPQKEFEAFCSYDRYHQILSTCDIALLPLTPTPVNLMKSDLKFLECAGHGIAVLASPTVYEQSIIHGETGLIYRTIQQFEIQLNELLKNASLRQKLAINAYNWVKKHRLLSQHYQQRRDWYLEMREQLPQLNQELWHRVPELFID